MISIEIDVLLLFYVCIGILLIFGLWFYYDQRDKQRFMNRNRKVIFHCIKCGHIYTAPIGTETADCPKCGFKNSRLRF